MNNLMILLLLTLTFVVSGCSESQESGVAAQGNEVQSLIDQAIAADQLAQQRQHAWIITDELLQDAITAQAANDEVAAKAAAERALFTANAALAQADKEQLAWRSRVPR